MSYMIFNMDTLHKYLNEDDIETIDCLWGEAAAAKMALCDDDEFALLIPHDHVAYEAVIGAWEEIQDARDRNCENIKMDICVSYDPPVDGELALIDAQIAELKEERCQLINKRIIDDE